MSWTDEEIDSMFQEGANGLQFDYKESYWREMETMLPKGGAKGDFLWFFMAFVFLGFFGVMTLLTLPNDTQSSVAMAKIAPAENQDKSLSEIEQVIQENGENGATSNSTQTADKELIAEYAVKASGKYLANSTYVAKTEKSGRKFIDVQNEESVSINVAESKSKEVSQLEQMVEPKVINQDRNDLGVVAGETHTVDSQENVMTKVPVGSLNYLELVLLEEDNRNLATYPSYPSKVSTTISMYVQALGGLSQSLISPSEQLSNSFGIGAGAQFKNRNWTYSIGVNGVVSNHKDLILNRSAKVYGFGSDVFNYHLNYQQLYILEGNLQVAYSLGKHNLNLGIRPSYAISSKVKMAEEKYTNSMVDASETNERNVYGFMGGLKRIGVKPSIGYSYSILPSLELGLNVGIQLMPMVNQDFLDGYTNKLPLDGQLYFRKTINFK